MKDSSAPECRVLALLPFLVKGARSLEIFRALPDRGVDVRIASCSASSPYAPDSAEDFIAQGRLTDLSSKGTDERFELVGEVIHSEKIEVLVQLGAPVYSLLPRWRESNSQIRIVDILYNEFGHTLNHFLFERCIDAVIVESESMRRYAVRASARMRPGIELVRSGVDLEWFKPPLNGPNGSPLTVGFIGRMSPEKNPMGFLELAERLLALDPHLEFLMAGDGPQAREIEQRVVASAYREHITYVGFVENSRSVLHQIDVLILPSKFDGQPAIVMEANACGVPVVAAPVGGIPELIRDSVNGHLLAPEETDAIRGLLSTWRKRPETLEQLRRSAREYACQFFDRERMVDDYARVFRRVATSGSALPRAS